MSPRTLFIANALASLIAVAGALIVYDRQVIRPVRTIGVVDLAEVYRVKEDEFTRRLTAARTENERQATLQMARSFSQRLSVALESLPYKVAVLHSSKTTLRRGDFIVFAFAGDGARSYPGLAGQPFFKIVRGLPGDKISVDGREVRINGEPVGIAKPHAFDRRPLEPIASGVIPPDCYYVQGLSPDSFDSRYRESGLVKAEQVIGVVDPIF